MQKWQKIWKVTFFGTIRLHGIPDSLNPNDIKRSTYAKNQGQIFIFDNQENFPTKRLLIMAVGPVRNPTIFRKYLILISFFVSSAISNGVSGRGVEKSNFLPILLV